MILIRLIAWLRLPVPSPEGLAALAHLLVFGLALTLVAQGEGRLALAAPDVAAAERTR